MCACLENDASIATEVCKWWGWYMSVFVHVLMSLSGVWECVCVLWHKLTGFSCL